MYAIRVSLHRPFCFTVSPWNWPISAFLSSHLLANFFTWPVSNRKTQEKNNDCVMYPNWTFDWCNFGRDGTTSPQTHSKQSNLYFQSAVHQQCLDMGSVVCQWESNTRQLHGEHYTDCHWHYLLPTSPVLPTWSGPWLHCHHPMKNLLCDS